MRRIAATLALAGLVLVTAGRAEADFHTVLIDALMERLDGDRNLQFIQMRMVVDRQHCQDSGKFVGETLGDPNAPGDAKGCATTGEGGQLLFFDVNGNQIGAPVTLPKNLAVGVSGRKFLVATESFAGLPGAPIPDFTLPEVPGIGGLIPPGSGKVCFVNRPGAPALARDCIGFGQIASDPQFGKPAAELPAPPDGTVAIRRVATTGNNSTDFALAVPEACNNANTCARFAASRPLFPYDPFEDVTGIAPERWRGFERVTASDPLARRTVAPTEAIRRVIDGQLQLTAAGDGATGSDTGVTGSVVNGVRINHPGLLPPNPDRVEILQARARVVEAVAEACPANPAASAVRATLVGHFFNDGSGAASPPGSAVGDIVAGVGLERSSQEGDRIVAFLHRCADPACTTVTRLKSRAFTTGWVPGEARRLRLEWDKNRTRFVFRVTSADGTETRSLSYNDLFLSDLPAPRVFVKDLRVEASMVNCAAGARQARVEARFDAFAINEVAEVFGPPPPP